MSMYTQLLEAAFGQHPPTGSGATERNPLDEVLRCRRELEEGVPKGVDPDTVPVVLALQIGYDVALLELARMVGIDTDPGRHVRRPPQRAVGARVAHRRHRHLRSPVTGNSLGRAHRRRWPPPG